MAASPSFVAAPGVATVHNGGSAQITANLLSNADREWLLSRYRAIDVMVQIGEPEAMRAAAAALVGSREASPSESVGVPVRQGGAFAIWDINKFNAALAYLQSIIAS